MNTSFSYTFLSLLGFLLCSCSDSKKDDYSAYFGGEIINPKGKWILFYKGEQLLDSIPLDPDNRFFIKFDSLSPGLYMFKHDPEYQYVYFDKNDSLMARINMLNFDESLVFCGKGEEKNNFLVEMYLKNQKDRNTTFSDFDLEEKEFSTKADSSYQEILKFYTENKEHILWNEEFDVVAKASVDFPYYSKKEFYPFANMRRNQKNSYPELALEFYNFRGNIDFNNEQLVDFSPYIQYISSFIENLANAENYQKTQENALKKLSIADSKVQNQALKNKIVSNIAFRYLMENEENISDTTFFTKYYQISTDSEKNDKVKSLVKSIQNLSETGYLPKIILKDIKNNEVSSDDVFQRKTILYFWSKRNENHFFAVHQKLQKIIEKYPNIDIISVNLDDKYDDWNAFLEKYKTVPNPKIKHYQISNFEEIKDKWVVNRETRAAIIDKNAKIIKGFTNIFEPTFDKQL